MNWYYGIFFFLIGAILASFYGVVATRLPEGKSLIFPRSHCKKCNHILSWYELIPIFSYLFLRGKCLKCKVNLPFYEFLLELCCGLLFSFGYFYYGFSENLWIFLVLISLAALIFVSDFGYMIILDSPLILSVTLLFFIKWFYEGISNAFLSLGSGILLFLFFLFLAFFGKRIFKRDALGGGDIKFSFVMGMTLGIPHSFLALILSSFLALPYATFSMIQTDEKEVPYGPFLVSSLCIVFFFYEKFSYILQLFYW